MKQTAQQLGVVRAKNARQKRKLQKQAPKVFENTKSTVLIKGGNVSSTVTNIMHDFHRLKVTHQEKKLLLTKIMFSNQIV